MAHPTDAKILLQELTKIARRLRARCQTDQYVFAQSMAHQFEKQTYALPEALLGNAKAVLRHFQRV